MFCFDEVLFWCLRVDGFEDESVDCDDCMFDWSEVGL